MQKVLTAVIVVEVQGVFSLTSIVENTRGRGACGGVVPVGALGHIASGARGWWWTLVSGGVEILLAVEDCDRVKREKQTIFGGKIVIDVNTHGGKGHGEGSHSLVDGGDGGVSGFEVLFLSSGGPLNVLVFHRKVVA